MIALCVFGGLAIGVVIWGATEQRPRSRVVLVTVGVLMWGAVCYGIGREAMRRELTASIEGSP